MLLPSLALTKLLSLIKNFDFQGLESSVESLQAAALRQDEYFASWAKSSNSMSWNLGPKMTVVESSQAVIRSDISSLRQDTSKIKSMMSADTKEPHSHTKGEHVSIEDDKAKEEPTRAVALIESSSRPPLTDPILEILTPEVQPITLAISTSQHEPSVPQREWKLTEEQIKAHMDKAEHIKKAAEETKIFEMTKIEAIKVVQEGAEKIRLDPKTIISAKVCEKFKKA
nr:hypothetical protein [Tanacetum cinerariifolium]